jgi:hypothetical protein
MTYITQNITSAGATIDASIGFGQYGNFRVTSTGTVALAANIVFSSTTVSGQQAQYEIRWEGDFTLGSFAVTIEGFSMNQSDVNQSGTFSCYFDGTAWSVQYFADGTDQPQVFYGVQSVTVLTSGTLTLTAGVSKYYQRLSGGPTTLVASYNVTANTAGVKDGTQFFIEIASGTTTGGNAFTVFGQTILAADALAGGAMVIATFDATANTWRSVYINKAIALTQFPAIAALSVLANGTNAAAVPTAIQSTANGRVFMQRGNALRFDWIEADNFTGSSNCLPLKYLAVEIPSAQVLTSFATPVNILDSITAGGLPIIQSVLFGMRSGGSAYAANTNIGIRPVGGSDDICFYNGALAIAGTDFYVQELIPNTPSGGSVLWGGDIEFYTKTGNPTTGTRNVLLMIIYTVIPAP